MDMGWLGYLDSVEHFTCWVGLSGSINVECAVHNGLVWVVCASELEDWVGLGDSDNFDM